LLDLAFTNNLEPNKGRILLSDPFMDEEFFRRSVVLLCDFNEEGSFGFILNNFLPLNLRELGPNFPDIVAQLTIGGPIDNDNLYFIHTLGDKINEAILILDGIYLGGNFEQLTQLIQEDNSILNQVRFFIGYSGWSKAQLEDEISEHNWVVINLPSLNELFVDKHKHTWNSYMERLGGKYKIFARSPINPSNN